MTVLTHTLPITLQQARKARRLSQLELSLRVGVSQRHVSFVESGRAKPSRNLLLAWLRELEAPLAVQNAALVQAGFAPAYGAATLSDPALLQANQALKHLVQAHDPMPAMVMDAHWNLLHLNQGAAWLTRTLLPWAADLPVAQVVNLLDLLVHPDGLARCIVNMHEVGPHLLARLRDEASVLPTLTPRVEAFAALLKAGAGDESLHTAWAQPVAPVLSTRFASPYGELSFFSMFTTFGAPQDITLASLRVEHMFAADEVTQRVLAREVGGTAVPEPRLPP